MIVKYFMSMNTFEIKCNVINKWCRGVNYEKESSSTSTTQQQQQQQRNNVKILNGQYLF